MYYNTFEKLLSILHNLFKAELGQGAHSNLLRPLAKFSTYMYKINLESCEAMTSPTP